MNRENRRSVMLPIELLHDVKVEAAKQDSSIRAYVEKAVSEMLKRDLQKGKE